MPSEGEDERPQQLDESTLLDDRPNLPAGFDPSVPPPAPSEPLLAIPTADESTLLSDITNVKAPISTTTALNQGLGLSMGINTAAERQAKIDKDTEALIESLKNQLNEVCGQRDQLNSKLVSVISRISDLEDETYQSEMVAESSKKKIAELEREREEHLHALDTGLLVERDNVHAEIQRLADHLVEEQTQRGVAEEGRKTVENEVDDLAATLFQQANTMVAAERLARSRAESRLANVEENLLITEGIVRELQSSLQNQPASSSSGEISPSNAAALVNATGTLSLRRALITSHSPYSEFILFLTHLRSLRPLSHTTAQTLQPPSMTSFLLHPFIARLITEDHDPALRLDQLGGSSSGVFSRVWSNEKKLVSHAILDGKLVIEPLPAHQVISTLQHQTTNGGLNANGEIVCSLSGKVVVPSSYLGELGLGREDGTETPELKKSTSRFFTRGGAGAGRPMSPGAGVSSGMGEKKVHSSSLIASLPPIYVFRIVNESPTTVGVADKPSHIFPIASDGWVLERLRSTCDLWHFIRTGIIASVWSGEDGSITHVPATPSLSHSGPNSSGLLAPTPTNGSGRPVLPPRKSWSLSGLGFKKETPPTSPKLDTAMTLPTSSAGVTMTVEHITPPPTEKVNGSAETKVEDEVEINVNEPTPQMTPLAEPNPTPSSSGHLEPETTGEGSPKSENEFSTPRGESESLPSVEDSSAPVEVVAEVTATPPKPPKKAARRKKAPPKAVIPEVVKGGDESEAHTPTVGSVQLPATEDEPAKSGEGANKEGVKTAQEKDKDEVALTGADEKKGEVDESVTKEKEEVDEPAPGVVDEVVPVAVEEEEVKKEVAMEEAEKSAIEETHISSIAPVEEGKQEVVEEKDEVTPTAVAAEEDEGKLSPSTPTTTSTPPPEPVETASMPPPSTTSAAPSLPPRSRPASVVVDSQPSPLPPPTPPRRAPAEVKAKPVAAPPPLPARNTSTAPPPTAAITTIGTDESWEEKTWKEVIRLKEEMFWSRIGSVKSS